MDDVDTHIVIVETNIKKANDGLSMMLLQPPGLVVKAAFNHQLQCLQQAYSDKESQHNISNRLMCSPRNHHQKSFMGLSYHLKVQSSFMADLNEVFSLQKAAQLRLDNLAQIRNRSTFINYSQQLGCIRGRLEMMKSLGCINNFNRSGIEKKKEEERKKLSEIFPNAIMMHI